MAVVFPHIRQAAGLQDPAGAGCCNLLDPKSATAFINELLLTYLALRFSMRIDVQARVDEIHCTVCDPIFQTNVPKGNPEEELTSYV